MCPDLRKEASKRFFVCGRGLEIVVCNTNYEQKKILSSSSAIDVYYYGNRR